MKNKTDLYSRLIAYQATTERSNLENFLTEMLCDFLNRIKKDQSLLFVRDVLLNGLPISYNDWFKNFGDKYQEAVWKTQQPIYCQGTIKYPDLMCFIDNKPILLVEVKIDAQFTQRTVISDDNEDLVIGQLKDYGTWLRSVNENAAMVLLTKATHPSADFLAKNSDYGISIRNVTLWQKVYDWLKMISRNSKYVPCITVDFMMFLKENNNNMANESPIHADFSVMELFIDGPGLRIGNSMANCRRELERNYSEGLRWRSEEKYLGNFLYRIEHKERIVWSWVILDSNEYSYIAWGFVFPDEQDVWKLRRSLGQLPKEPFLFVGLFTNSEIIKSNFSKAIDGRPSDWLWAKNTGLNECLGLIHSQMAPMLKYDVNFTLEFFNWVNKHFQSALSFFKAFTSQNSKGN